MTMSPGPMKEGRDWFFQSKDARGLNVLEPSEEDGTLDRWEEMKFVFGYDAEDDADNWWVQWGLLAMCAKGINMKQAGPDGLAVQIDEHYLNLFFCMSMLSHMSLCQCLAEERPTAVQRTLKNVRQPSQITQGVQLMEEVGER
jgi:hypothetical protein